MDDPHAKSTTRLWVLASNDLEAIEISKLLKSHGETVCVSKQPWGATWRGLESEIKRALEQFRQEHPEGQIFGIELRGRNRFGARDIDHHRYSDCDRSSILSSLEQVAALLGVELNRWQKLIAANDRGYSPAMIATGATPEEVEQIRAADRSAQGLTPEDEERAELDIRTRAEWRACKVLVLCLHRPTSAHSDRLFALADEILLAGPGEWDYSGHRHRMLADIWFPEKHWSGGSPTSGYFCIENPSTASQRRLTDFFWA
jgi:hypothetical protein